MFEVLGYGLLFYAMQNAPLGESFFFFYISHYTKTLQSVKNSTSQTAACQNIPWKLGKILMLLTQGQTDKRNMYTIFVLREKYTYILQK